VNAPAAEPERSFAAAADSGSFGGPVLADAQHEQTQQEDYLWGV
jgi:hypothetical protein